MNPSVDSFIVFAKEPVPGEVKTRLTPPLAPEQAATLYTAFVEDTVATVARAADPGDRKVISAPNGPGPILTAIAGRHGFLTGDQQGDDLGARMRNAIAGEMSLGASAVVIVGSDSPTMPLDSLTRARELLRRKGAVLGPAGDGGYWLIGAAGGIPDLFEGIRWSTRDVLLATLERARAHAIELGLLPFWYDVDDVQDLRLLAAHLEWLPDGTIAPRTRAAVAALKASHGAFFLA
jgi:rSAM/selenodomain-associated transferase 1